MDCIIGPGAIISWKKITRDVLLQIHEWLGRQARSSRFIEVNGWHVG